MASMSRSVNSDAAADGVVQVRPADDEVLGAPHEQGLATGLVDRAPGRAHALDRGRNLAQRRIRIPGGGRAAILDARASHRGEDHRIDHGDDPEKA
jgi:hypothetical protein